MFKQQPMKMAAARGAVGRSGLRAVLDLRLRRRQQGHNSVELSIPGYCRSCGRRLQFVVPGINDTNKAEQAKYGPGDYRPIIPVTSGVPLDDLLRQWRPRIGLAGLWLTRKKFMLPQHLRVGDDESAERGPLQEQGARPKLTKLYWLVRLDLRLPSDRQLLGLDLHRDGPPAVVVYGLFQTRDAVSPASPRARSSPR